MEYSLSILYNVFLGKFGAHELCKTFHENFNGLVNDFNDEAGGLFFY